MTAIGGKANVWLLCVCVLGCQSSTVADRATALSDSAISSYDVSPIGKQIVLSSASGELFLLDIATQRVERLTKTPHFDTTPAFSPDESFIVFASAPSDHSRSHIVRLSLVDKQVAQLTVDDNFYDSSPRFSRDGSRIVFSRAHRHRPYSMGGMTWDDWDIYVMDADGSNVNRVTNQKYRSITTPNFGNDGQTVFFSSRVKRQNSSRYSAIFRASISDEQPPTNLTPDDQNTVGSAALGSQPAVSTDGSMIVFISDRRTKYDYDLWLMNLDGSNPTPLNLTRVSEYNALPIFAPNGKHVFFLAKSGSNAESRPLFSLWQAETNGQNPHQITADIPDPVD